jgi:hypothetical protein
LAGASDTTATVREESEDQQQSEYKVSADTATVWTGKLEVLNVVLQPHLTVERPVTISVIKSRRVKWVGKEVKIVFKVLVRKREGKRHLGRPRNTWKSMFYDIGTLLIHCPHWILNSITLNTSGISQKYCSKLTQTVIVHSASSCLSEHK